MPLLVTLRIQVPSPYEQASHAATVHMAWTCRATEDSVDVPFVGRILSLGFGLGELFPALPAGSGRVFKLMLFWAVAVLCSVGLGLAKCLCCE